MFPSILQEIFQRFNSNNNTQNLGDLFVELDSILGSRVVRRALKIIDEQTIVIYHNQLKTTEIAEINEGRPGSLKLVHLFPRLNYCTCDFFQNQVLGDTNSAAPYTCEHVLALRLSHLLKAEKLRFEEVPQAKLNILRTHFVGPDPDSNSDID